MLTIYKYQMNADDVIVVEIPKDAKILTVQMQGETPCIWAAVNPDARKVERRFRMYGTGHPIDENLTLEYIDTFQMHGGMLVFHLFEDFTIQTLDNVTPLEIAAMTD